MREFQSVVQDLLHNHERHRRYVAFLTVLCLIMSFTVSLILIEPAESRTGELVCEHAEHVHSEECYALALNEEGEEVVVLVCGQEEHEHSLECYEVIEEDVALEDEDTQRSTTSSGINPFLQSAFTPLAFNAADYTEPNVNDGEYFDSVVTVPNVDKWYDFSDDLKVGTAVDGEGNVTEGVELSGGHHMSQDEIDDLKSSHPDIEDWNFDYYYEADGDKVNLSFKLVYSILNALDDGSYHVDENQPYIYFQLPEGVTVPKDFYGEECQILDSSYVGVAAYYSISKDGLVVIRFTEDYIKQKILKSSSFWGSLEFKGEIERAETSDGDRIVSIGDQDIYVEFEDETYNISKHHDEIIDSTGVNPPRVRWKITVEKFYDDSSLNGLRVYDKRFPGDGVTWKSDPEGAAIAIPSDDGTYYTIEGDANSITFYFEEDLTKDDEKNAWYQDNEAFLKDSNGVDIGKDDDEMTVSSVPSFKKTGHVNSDSDTITWTINVKTPAYNENLAGYTVRDANGFALENTDVVVKTKDGITIPEGSGWHYDYENGKPVSITFDDNFNYTDVTITYTSTFDDHLDGYTELKSNDWHETEPGSNVWVQDTVGHRITNKAYLFKDDTQLKESTDTADIVDSTVTKSGSYDGASNLLNWVVEAKFLYASADTRFENYVLTDDAWENLTLYNINVPSASVEIKQSGNTVKADLVYEVLDENHAVLKKDGVVYANITKNGKDITIDSVGDGKGVDYVKFEYSTSRSNSGNDGTKVVQGTDGTEDEGKTFIENTVTCEDGSDTASVDGTISQGITKTLLSQKQGYVYDEGGTASVVNELSWNIEIVNDKEFGEEDVMVVIDTLGVEGDNASHYIIVPKDGELPDGFELKASTNQWWYDTNPVFGEDYTIEYYDASGNKVEAGGHATQFQIIFTKKFKESAYFHYISISYKTIAEITNMEKGHTATFTNGANFDGNTPGETPSYEFEVKDSENIEKISIGVNKVWDDSETTHPDSITFHVERKLSTEGEDRWQTIYWDTAAQKWLVLTSDKTDVTQAQYQYTISAPSWQFVDSDGRFQKFVKETTDLNAYQYRIVEDTALDGYSVVYSNDSITESGTITITNSKPEVEKLVIGADGNAYESYEFKTSELDQIIINGKDYYSIVYEITLNHFGKSLTKVTDILPPGFELATSGGYEPKLIKDDNQYDSMYAADDYNRDNRYVYNSGDDPPTVEFLVKNGDSTYVKLQYRLIYPISELDSELSYMLEGIDFENTVSLDNGCEDKVNVKIKGSTSDGSNETDGILDKTVESSFGKDGSIIKSNNGYISYSIYVNPEGKDLSNTDEYDIIDELNLLSFSGMTESEMRQAIDAGLISIKVQRITDFYVDDDGIPHATVYGDPLTSDKYSYTIDYKPGMETEYGNGDETIVSGLRPSGNWLTLPDLSSYDSKTLKFKVTFDSETDFSQFDFYFQVENHPTEENNVWFDIPEDSITYDPDTKTATFLFTPSDRIGLKAFFDNNQNSLDCSVDIMLSDQDVTTYEATARLTLTVPDNTALKITYTYSLTNNGEALAGDSTFNMKNRVSMDTGNVSAWDEEYNSFRENASSSGEVHVEQYPRIVKYNVGNHSARLAANFYLAEYTDGKWYFASEIDDSTIVNGETLHKLKFDEEANGQEIPAKAEQIEITDDIKEDGFMLQLNKGKFYKLVEVTAPDGYEAADKEVLAIANMIRAENSNASEEDSLPETLEDLIKAYLPDPDTFTSNPLYKRYKVLLEKFISVHYFKYSTTSAAEGDVPELPDGATYSVLRSTASLGVPNNDLITITATKTWSENVGDDAWVELTLYYSTKKVTNGFPAWDDLTLADADSLGMQELDPVAYVKARDADQVGPPSPTWTGLPNGINDSPIYYYVVETAYSLDNKATWYKLDQESGVYYNGYEQGVYLPTYTGNAVNKDDTVSVRNSTGLSITKAWKDSANQDLDDASIPYDEITYKLYGVKSDGTVELIKTDKLTKQNNWTEELDKELLEEYESFIVKEVRDDDTLYGYQTDINYNYTGIGAAANGEILIINRDPTPTEIKFSVEKSWSDDSGNTQDPIKVYLYRSPVYLTTAQIETLSKNPNAELHDAEGNKINVELVDFEQLEEEGYTIGGHNRKTNPDTISKSDNWKLTWTGLPYRGNGVSKYIYYAIEDAKSIPKDYLSSHSRTVDQTDEQGVLITNAIPGQVQVEKEWMTSGENGQKIESDYPEDSIKFKLYQRVKSSTFNRDYLNEWEGKTINIMAMGDSITDGYSYTGSYRKYLYHYLTSEDYYGLTVDMKGSKNDGSSMMSITTSDGRNITFDSDNEGVSQIAIEKTSKRSGILERIKENQSVSKNKPDIILLLIGTNDIFDDGENGATVLTVSDYEAKYAKLIKEIFDQEDGHEVTVFMMYPPPINVNGKDTWMSPEDQPRIDGNISKAIEAIDNVIASANANEHYNGTLYALNLNAFFKSYKDYPSSMLRDYCHPTELGYDRMATYLADHIAYYLAMGTVKDENSQDENGGTKLGDDGLPMDFYNEDGSINTEVYQEVEDFEFELNAKDDWSGEFSLPGIDGEYFLVEESTGKVWDAKYSENGFDGIEGGSVKVTNTLDVISFDLEKVWADGNSRPSGSINVEIHRSTNLEDVPSGSLAFMPNLSRNDDGKYSVSVSEDGEITITFNKEITDVKSSDPTIADADFDGKTVTISGKSIGGSNGAETTITVYCGDEEIEITVKVSKFTASSSEYVLIIGADGYANLSASNSGVDVTGDTIFTASPSDSLEIINGNQVRALNYGNNGKVTITAKCGDMSTSFDVTVKYPDGGFELTGAPSTFVGGSTQLTPNPNVGKFTYSTSDSSVAAVSDSGLVTGVSEGEVTITATRDDGETAELTIRVTQSDELIVFYNGTEVNDGDTFEIEVGDTFTLSYASKKTISLNQYTGCYNYLDIVPIDNGFTVVGKYETPYYSEPRSTTAITLQEDYQDALTINIRVNPHIALAFTRSSLSLLYNDEIDLYDYVNKDSDVFFTIKSGSDDVVELNGSKLKAKALDGNVTIIATYKDDPAVELTIEVVKELTQLPGGTVNGYEYTYDANNGLIVITLNEANRESSGNYQFGNISSDNLLKDLIPYECIIESSGIVTNYYAWVFGNGKGSYSLSGNIISGTSNENLTFAQIGSDIGFGLYDNNYATTITIKVRTTAAASLSLTKSILANSSIAPYAITDPTYYKTVTIFGNEGWQKELKNLPKYADDGITPYYYWVVESSKDAAAYTVTYQYYDSDGKPIYNGKTADNGGKVVITNYSVYNDGTQMPSTGSTGTRGYTAVGITLTGTALAFLLLKRRKSANERDGPR